nr:retrovirus-related Pol polyprotein from transposon TNT 1-94 [Tanacetum cinerariifolium]
MKEDKIKKKLEEIETINIELDHRVSKLIAENEHLKQTYKKLYDSIKSARIRSKEQCDDLINQVNLKSMEISDLTASLQEKNLVIIALKNALRKLKGNALADDVVTSHSIDPESLMKKLVAMTPKNKDKIVRFTKPVPPSGNTTTNNTFSSNLVSNKPALSSTGVKSSTRASGSQPSGNTKKAKIQRPPSSTQKNKVEAHPRIVKTSLKNKNHTVEPKGTAFVQHSTLNRKVWKPTGKVFTNIRYTWRPTGQTFTIVGNVCPLTRITTTTEVVQIVLWYSNSGCSKHMTEDRSQLTNFVNKFLEPVKFENDHVAKIMDYGDYQIGNVTISRVYYLEGLRHNLFSVGKFYMMASSPICLLSKASKTKSWLWNRRLSHLNFGAINHLSRQGLVRGLLKLKFEKDHLCSACAMGKSKKKPHKPKSEDTNQEKLYLLHMDLCRPIRVASINGKKYIPGIVDDYSRFTWVKCLRAKDETPYFIIKYLKMIQVRLKVHVRRIRTDNGTEFVNQTLREYYEQVDISHETFVARSLQQNGVVKRRNRTLIEAAHTMLIYAKALLFLWAEAVATACYTQNCSIVRLCHGKTPYELLHDKLPDLSFFYVFGALCYPTNDSENLGKLQPKANIGIFIGYAPTKKAFRIYNRRTMRIIETIHVDFDELIAMASEQSSLGSALHEMTHVTISSGIVPNPPPSTLFVPLSRTDRDMLFQPLFDKLLTPPPSVDHPASAVIALIAKVDHPLENIIGQLARPVLTRLQLHEQALFYYYDAFLTSVEPKTYKDALTQSCWIEALQEELNEFERLGVWELVPRPDKVMVITLKWIYKVKLDKLGEVGISHETSVARSSQQNGVVERRNHTLIEAALTMLIYAQAPLFLWAEAVATACEGY